MKTLVLILALVAQDMVAADGKTWKRIAVGYPDNAKKFNLWVETPIGGTKERPEVRAKKETGPIRLVALDCKAHKFNVSGDGRGWVKAPKGSVGAILLKFACK